MYRDRFWSGKEEERRTLKRVVGEVMEKREMARGEETMLRGGSDGGETSGRAGGLGVWRVE